MKRAIAIALMGLGLSLVGQNPAAAATMSIAGLSAPAAQQKDGSAIPAGANACWWDLPVIGAGVAFFELLRDDEFDRHCAARYHYAPRYAKQKRAHHRHLK